MRAAEDARRRRPRRGCKGCTYGEGGRRVNRKGCLLSTGQAVHGPYFQQPTRRLLQWPYSTTHFRREGVRTMAINLLPIEASAMAKPATGEQFHDRTIHTNPAASGLRTWGSTIPINAKLASRRARLRRGPAVRYVHTLAGRHIRSSRISAQSVSFGCQDRRTQCPVAGHAGIRR